MLGNEMQKGNCCGGYNSNNEDYVWEMKKNFWYYLQIFCFVAGATLCVRILFFNRKKL